VFRIFSVKLGHSSNNLKQNFKYHHALHAFQKLSLANLSEVRYPKGIKFVFYNFILQFLNYTEK